MVQIASGTYTGTGASQDVNVGFAADLVIVKGGTSIAQLWTSTMGATTCKPWTGNTAVDATTGISQHASGFTVGANVATNTLSTTYYYLAVKDNAVADFQVGSYTGDGNDNRSLAVLDFDPNFLLIASAGADGMVCRFSTNNGDSSFVMNAATAANIIQSFITNGWTVGTGTTVNNADARTYYYAAFKNTANLFKVIDDGSNRAYLGDTSDDRTITGAGFAPDAFAFVKSVGAVVPVARFKAHSGDQSALMDASSAVLTNRIQAFAADGFQVGSNTNVNAAVDMHALVMKEGASSPPASTLNPAHMMMLGVSW